MSLLCIYCKKQKKASKSHIIPEAIGKGPILKEGVCHSCNNKTNSAFENKASNTLNVIRYWLQLKGKKRKHAAVVIEFDFKGAKYATSLRPFEDIRKKTLVFKGARNIQGHKKAIAFVGLNKPELDKLTKHYASRHPDTKWEDIDPNLIDELNFTLEFKPEVFASDEILRTVAKIALEYLCLEKGAHFVANSDFDNIRSYILTGSKPTTGLPIANLCADFDIWKALHNVPFGFNSILLSEDPSSRLLVAIVGIYGLAFYKIILTRNYQCLALRRTTKFTIISPQTGKGYSPVIQTTNRVPSINKAAPKDLVPATTIIKTLAPSIVQRVQKGLRRLHEKSLPSEEQ